MKVTFEVQILEKVAFAVRYPAEVVVTLGLAERDGYRAGYIRVAGNNLNQHPEDHHWGSLLAIRTVDHHSSLEFQEGAAAACWGLAAGLVQDEALSYLVAAGL